MKTQALKGMRDLLPAEQTLRDYIQGKILETYRASGFERISAPSAPRRAVCGSSCSVISTFWVTPPPTPKWN